MHRGLLKWSARVPDAAQAASKRNAVRTREAGGNVPDIFLFFYEGVLRCHGFGLWSGGMIKGGDGR